LLRHNRAVRTHRALYPLALVALLGLLTAGAAVLGSSQSPTLYFPSVPANDPAAKSVLDLALERTMAAPSFTWHVPPSVGPETLIYNAPNRIHDYRGSSPASQSIGVGTTYYFEASDYSESSNGAQDWVKLDAPVGYSDANIYALKYLSQLQQAQSVQPLCCLSSRI
jgi:hypothetical protein